MKNEDESLTDEEWLADQRAKALKFGGGYLPKDQMDELERRHYENSSAKKWPDANGCEMGQLTPEGGIEIIQSSTTDGMNSHGSTVYPADDEEFEYYFKRHHFDDPKGKIHVIMKKFDEQSNRWIELGEDWI